MSHPDYVVIRPAADLPPGFLPPELDGKWFDAATMPKRFGDPRGNYVTESGVTVGEAVAIPSGRFEVRDDGAVAEVWEVRP